MPLVAIALAGIFVAVVALSRWVSLGSVVVAVLFPVLSYLRYSNDPVSVVLTLVAAGLVIWRHRTNISRIIAGTEPKIGESGRTATR
jgi:glycerol-3-phosphate acyltransferase PlsY